MNYRISRRANTDIERICDRIAEDNPDAADRLDEQVHRAIQLLAKFPGMGHTRADVEDKRRESCKEVEFRFSLTRELGLLHSRRFLSHQWFGGLRRRWRMRVVQGAIGVVCGGIGGAAGGLIVARIGLAGISAGRGDYFSVDIHRAGAAFCFSVVGALLGVFGASLCRTPRSRYGLWVGTVIGFAAGLGVSFWGNQLVHANPGSSSERFQRLAMFAFGSLACVALAATLGIASGAILDMVAARRRADSSGIAEPDDNENEDDLHTGRAGTSRGTLMTIVNVFGLLALGVLVVGAIPFAIGFLGW